MALDRSYAEVMKAMTPRGGLRKFHLLDSDWDFHSRTLGGYIDGTDAEFAELKTLRNLAPGDFRTVRQEQFYLDEAQTNLDRIAALRAECLLKRDGDRSAKIGFAG